MMGFNRHTMKLVSLLLMLAAHGSTAFLPSYRGVLSQRIYDQHMFQNVRLHDKTSNEEVEAAAISQLDEEQKQLNEEMEAVLSKFGHEQENEELKLKQEEYESIIDKLKRDMQNMEESLLQWQLKVEDLEDGLRNKEEALSQSQRKVKNLENKLEVQTQKYTKASIEWEDLLENEQTARRNDQEQAKVDLIKAVALEQERAAAIQSSLQSVVEQKEKSIGELESERNRIRNLVGNILRVTKERVINVVRGTKEWVTKPIRSIRDQGDKGDFL